METEAKIAQTDYAAIELRIERFIVVIGLTVAVVLSLPEGLAVAAGVAAGTFLCWFNFRWLRQGAEGVIRVGLTQAGAANVHVPKSLHAKFFGRLLLLGLSVYATLVWLQLPGFAVLIGLAAVVPAVVFELGYELVRGYLR